MKKLFKWWPRILICLFILVLGFGVGYAARNFTLNDSHIKNMCLEVFPDGEVVVTLVGDVIDDTGQVQGTKNLVLNFEDMPAQVRVNFNNVMRLLSQQYNHEFCNENVPTWEDR